MQKTVSKIVLSIALVCLAAALVSVLPYSLGTAAGVGAFLGMAAAVALAAFLLHHFSAWCTEKRCLLLFCVLATVVLAGMFAVVCTQSYSPHGDYDAVYVAAKEIASYGNAVDSNLYLLNYPHQQFSAVFYGVLNRVFMMFGAQSVVSLRATGVANALMAWAGFILFFFTVRRLAGGKAALLCASIYGLNVTIYTANLLLYSHALAPLFLNAVLFFTTYACTAERKKRSCGLRVRQVWHWRWQKVWKAYFC